MTTNFYIHGKDGDVPLTFPSNSLLSELNAAVPEKDVDLRMNFKGTCIDMRARGTQNWSSMIKSENRLETTELSDKIDTLFRRLFYQLHEEDKKYGGYLSTSRIHPFQKARLSVLKADDAIKQLWLNGSDVSRGLSLLQKVFMSIWYYIKELFYFIKCSWHALLLNY